MVVHADPSVGVSDGDVEGEVVVESSTGTVVHGVGVGVVEIELG